MEKKKNTAQAKKPALSVQAARPAANRTVLIRKSNDLVEGRYKFDIWETRIFLKMLTHIKADDRDFHEYKIYIKDIIDTFGVDSKDSYRLIKEGAVKLMGKTIQTKIKVESGWEDFIAPIVAGFKGKAEANEPSYIKLSFHPDMKPLLLELRERFLVYDFQNVRHLSSPYYIRIYELLKQYEKIGERRFEVDELRAILGMQEEYKLYGHFKSRIIEPSRERLAQYTDISFTYSEVKRGRAVGEIIFHIRSNRSPKTTENRRNAPNALPESASPEISSPEIQVAENPIFETYFSRLNDWWGIQSAEFKKRLGDKTETDIERAIEFTKDRIRSGKAENPAGVFLAALEKGHKTIRQHRAEKLADQQKEATERAQKLAELVQRYNAVSEEYASKINEMVRAIATVHPEVGEEAVAEIKQSYRMAGDHRLENLEIEGFRRDPMLRSMVIAGIVRRFPARFSELEEKYLPEIEAAKAEIRTLKPDAVFQ